MADDEQIFAVGVITEKFLEVLKTSLGGEGGGAEDGCFVAGLGAYEGGGLEATLEGARDDEVELYVQCIQYMRELDAVFFPFFIKGALRVKERIRAPHSGACVTQDEQIHSQFTSYRSAFSDDFGW